MKEIFTSIVPIYYNYNKIIMRIIYGNSFCDKLVCCKMVCFTTKMPVPNGILDKTMACHRNLIRTISLRTKAKLQIHILENQVVGLDYKVISWHYLSAKTSK